MQQSLYAHAQNKIRRLHRLGHRLCGKVRQRRNNFTVTFILSLCYLAVPSRLLSWLTLRLLVLSLFDFSLFFPCFTVPLLFFQSPHIGSFSTRLHWTIVLTKLFASSFGRWFVTWQTTNCRVTIPQSVVPLSTVDQIPRRLKGILDEYNDKTSFSWKTQNTELKWRSTTTKSQKYTKVIQNQINGVIYLCSKSTIVITVSFPFTSWIWTNRFSKKRLFKSQLQVVKLQVSSHSHVPTLSLSPSICILYYVETYLQREPLVTGTGTMVTSRDFPLHCLRDRPFSFRTSISKNQIDGNLTTWNNLRHKIGISCPYTKKICTYWLHISLKMYCQYQQIYRCKILDNLLIYYSYNMCTWNNNISLQFGVLTTNLSYRGKAATV